MKLVNLSRRVLGVGCLALLTVLPLGAVPRIDHEAECTYKQLSWDDFRGPAERGQQVAWLATGIKMDRLETVVEEVAGGVVARVKYPAVYAYADKLRSGVRSGAKTPQTLAHEQLHFDIAEYHARRLYHEIRTLEMKAESGSTRLRLDVRDAVQQAHTRTMQDLDRMQATYDGETVHGTRKRQQKQWAAKVADLLAGVEPYPLH